MTGYGRGEAGRDGVKFTVELTSTNRRQGEIIIDLPRELVELEPRIRDEINARLSRGRIDVVIACHRANNKHASVRLDHALARGIARSAKQLQKELGLAGELSMDTLLRMPNVLHTTAQIDDPQHFWPTIQNALQSALSKLVKMREKEGKHLRDALVKHLGKVEAEISKIHTEAPNVVKRYQQQLRERIAASGVDVSVSDERLMKEIVFFADRSDITEELTRLESHIKQFRESLDAAEAVGRTLDFLAQEMFRETNTIGAKANDMAISRAVVTMKGELEKIREQIQNVE